MTMALRLNFILVSRDHGVLASTSEKAKCGDVCCLQGQTWPEQSPFSLSLALDGPFLASYQLNHRRICQKH